MDNSGIVSIRKIDKNDKTLFMDFVNVFYNSDAVIAPVPDEYHEKAFDELLRGETYQEGYILEYGGQPSGYALLSKTFSQEAGGMVVWLEELFVTQEFRGKGIGSTFFDYMCENIPAVRYRLEVEPDNKRAIALYERKGFEILPYMQMKKGH